LPHGVQKQKNDNSPLPAITVYPLALNVLERAMGNDRNQESAADAICRTLIEQLNTKLCDKLLKDHDLSYLPDIPFIYSLSARHIIIGGDDLGIDNFVKNVTHYTLSLDLNVKANLKSQVTQSAHLQGKADFVVELDT